MRRPLMISAAVGALLAGTWLASPPPAAGQAAGPDAGARCAALASVVGGAMGDPTARVVEAKFNPASASRPNPNPMAQGGASAMPEHCEVLGVMRERTGSDGQRYAVRFRVRLPIAWNGRFLFEGSGGTAGSLGEASGRLQPGVANGLTQGFAVASTDTGHDNALNSNPARQGQVAFAHDYEARLEHAEKSLNSVAMAGKGLIQAYYGRAAHHSYFAGCSNGGREGMVFAQRFPDQFDGILATAPAFAVPKAAIAEVADTKIFASLAAAQGQFRPGGLPDLTRTFSNADFKLVADATLAACDSADGVKDGMVQDTLGCTTAKVTRELAKRTCKAGKTDSCLSPGQVDAMVRSLAGPRDSKGRTLYSDWPWDPGIAETGWRVWKIGLPGMPAPINVTLGGAALSGLFVTPPVEMSGSSDALLRYQFGFDYDRDAPKIFGTNAQFPRSGWDLIGAKSTDLSRFRNRGGKLLVPHGGADPIFSINDTVRWWNEVNHVNRGTAANFVRVYAVPGMNHCAGGPATDQYDALKALVGWVEDRRAPDRIEAAAGQATPWPGRTRPLCPYPTVARYRGGDVEMSSSFVCR